MTFFYDLNKKLNEIRATPELTHTQLNERDMSRAAKGYEKYGKEGMRKLSQAGMDGKPLDPIRKKFDKYDEAVEEGKGDGNLANNAKPYDKVTRGDVISGRLGKDEMGGKAKEVDEGVMDVAKKVGGAIKKGARALDKAVTGGSPEDLRKDLQKKMGLPQTGKKPGTNESIKLIAVKEGADKTVRVYRDTAYNEFHVRVFSKGQEVVASRYFTESQDDAITTADYMVEGTFTMTPKQKSFAKLAPPTDKITFADKIAGAKKEVDEMLGDVAAEAMKKALGGGMGRNASMGEASGSINFDKVLDAVAALYGDDMWHNDSMQDVAHDLEQQQPTDQELDFIIAKGRLPKRLANTQFTNNDSVKFGEASDDNSPFTAHKRPRVDKPKVGSTERGALHDIEHTATGRKVTRRVDPNTGHSVGTDDDKPGEKRGRGRPGGKGAGKSIGAKGPSGKSKLMTREGPDDLADQGEYDQEGDMALDDINTIESAANELQSIIDANDNLPEWVQSKINKAMDYLDTARDYMSAQEDDEQMIDEKAVSKKQQKFMGMVHAAQKGKKPASKEVAKVAKSMGKKDAEDFASTKHKGLPNKVKEESTDKEDQKAERAGKRVAKDIEHDEGHKGRDDNRAEKAGKRATKDIEYDDKKDRKEKKKDEVEENTVAGSVAPAMGGKASKGSGGMTFGKGVYESTIAKNFNSKLKTVLNEGMSVNMSADQDGKKSLTVTATDDDAVKLSQLLNLAGIGGQSQGYGSVCPGCGSADCGCDQMQEDLANSADNTEYADTNYMVNGLSGGLDGQKTDQSTLGTVINQDPRRTIGSVAESNDVVELYKRIA